ncbi:hypothetical protein ASZ90_018615 [hydrocarbon metagenome]|uniref:DGC domain protein n=1 Tax=hydrocarbon metagenome TaxID=938273 RepID=A0A0W8E6D0_9ZZZZ
MSQAIEIPLNPKPVKVGIIPCNGEEICAGSITRFACRKVLDEMRKGQAVTLCLPLFIAGDKGEQKFATRFPTITVDGCDKRCSAISTERLSGKPAHSFVITDMIKEAGLELSDSPRTLNESDQEVVNLVAEEIAKKVDEILGKEGDE